MTVDWKKGLLRHTEPSSSNPRTAGGFGMYSQLNTG